MKVIVVGAGIGGLGAAIALNRGGHDVEVYESSSFLNEVGAAIHLAPNATRVLKGWGFGFDTMFPVECEAVKIYNKNLEPFEFGVNRREAQESLGIDDPWLLVHRVDLHSALRVFAEKGFQGRPVKIHLNSKVHCVNAETGEVHFQDGRTVQGDLVVGADGLHSRTVQAIISNGRDKISTGQEMFRFLVPTEKAEKSPPVKKLIDTLGLDRTSIIGTTRERVIIYPCRSGTLLNCGFVYPTENARGRAAADTSWLNAGRLGDLVTLIEDFDEGVRELTKMAEDLKLWSLATRDPPPTYVKGKLALVGDAAHPMLPHQGQGGAQALEDAAALGAVFAKATEPEQVEELLGIYNKVRYEHTVTACITSRVSYERRGETLDELRRFIPNVTFEEGNSAYNIWDIWDSYPVREVERLLALRSDAAS